MTDTRYRFIRERLESLTTRQLQEIVSNQDKLLFDEFNFHNGKFCPMAIAVGCHKMNRPTDQRVREAIGKVFNPVNIMRGVPGTFYHGTDEERRRDLLGLIEEIIVERVRTQLDASHHRPSLKEILPDSYK